MVTSSDDRVFRVQPSARAMLPGSEAQRPKDRVASHLRPLLWACALLAATACVGANPPNIYSIGGSVSGLLNPGLVLQVNGTADLSVDPGTTSFRFANWFVEGASYAVDVPTQPRGQVCTVSNGTGTVGKMDVRTVMVTCMPPPPINLTYSTNPATYPADRAIPENLPSSGGGAVSAYSISPALPVGLNLNPSTGVISGTPTVVTPVATYTVTASNPGGSVNTSLIVAVFVPPLSISSHPASQTVSTGENATFSVTAQGRGGASLNYQWRKNGVAIADATSSSYTTPGIAREETGASFDVIVSDTSGNSVTSKAARVHVRGTFIATDKSIEARSYHTATLLNDGRVLIVGGTGSTTAELYNPSTETFEVTGRPIAARDYHTATLLPNGKVLVVGGTPDESAELYDPSTGTFEATGSPSAIRQLGHTATLLTSGRILILGGTGMGKLAGAELYDPETGSFAPAKNGPITARARHTATLLGSGKLLVAGGESDGSPLASAELYDPEGEKFSSAGELHSARAYHAATLLGDGRVLVAGGYNNSIPGAELYGSDGTFSTTASTPTPRMLHTATLLPSGEVLLTGGAGASKMMDFLKSADLYKLDGTFSSTGSMAGPRYGHTATLLPNGKVLVVGGGADPELYQ